MKLAALGKAALEALKEAAKSESREVSVRSIQILKGHLESEDEDLKRDAKAALEALADGEGFSAQRAADALKPKVESPNRPRGLPRNIRIAGGNFQIQVQAIAGNGKNIRVKNANGVKEIDVQENGLKVKIVDDPNNGIKMEVTKKDENGKEETKKYAAKNADDLKKNDPEAHKLFEKYSKDPGIGIQVQGLQAGGPRVPLQLLPVQPGQVPNPPQPIRVFNPRQAAQDLRDARREIMELIEETNKQIEEDSEAGKRLKEVVERLESTEKKLGEALQKLGPFGR